MYIVLGSSTGAMFLSNDPSLYAPRMNVMLDFTFIHVSAHLSCEERVKSKIIQNEKVLPQVGLEPSTFILSQTF